MKKSVIIVLVILLVLCLCTLLCAGGAYFGWKYLERSWPTAIASVVSHLPDGPTPTPFVISTMPASGVPRDTLTLLEQTEVPESDLPALVCRLKGICGVPLTVEATPAPLSIGAQATFWVTNTDTNRDFQVTATLRYITPHLYFWAENNTEVDEAEMRDLCETFENKIYPTDREFFGSEWTPGVDNDPHIYILYVGGIGDSTAGYFSAQDSYPPAVREHSNAHEMFVINSSQDLGDSYTYSTLAHEFQHMIHWHQDPNEGELLDEGFSELASFLNGYDTGGFDWVYSLDPDINLLDWQQDVGSNSAHYGANFLFVNYFLNRFGEQATQALVHEPLNGLESVDAVLRQLNITDPASGQPMTADDFFQDWTIANFLNDPSIENGRYSYANYHRAPTTASAAETIASCPPPAPVTRTVNQYGVDYFDILCQGNYTLSFHGAPSVRLLPVNPHSGEYAFWSNKGNNSDMTLTRAFDFTNVNGPIALTYWTWYDIETDYDYVYLEASTDGEHWQILNTPSGTGENPTGSSLGWAYNDKSGGWIQEQVDLSPFAGQKVWLRFEYVTDMAVNGEGFLLDDVSISALNYVADFERDDGGWEGAGFVRVRNILPQTFRLTLLHHSLDGTISIERIPLNADNTASISISLEAGEKVTLIVSATTRFTREAAGYQIDIR
jgi:hypothetical protein